jgi:hypothetical protein
LDNSVKMENSIQPGMIKYSIAALNRKLNRWLLLYYSSIYSISISRKD